MMNVHLVDGDLIDQDVEAIVNAWNRDIIPWWLLIPQGVSGAIKQRAGLQPFREPARFGPIPLGGTVHTTAGRLPFLAIIHVAGINMLWRASHASIADSVTNAVGLAGRLGLKSLAFPILGAGSGGFKATNAEAVMREAFATMESPIQAKIVRYRPTRRGK